MSNPRARFGQAAQAPAEDYEDDDLTDDEAEQGLIVVELGPRGLKGNHPDRNHADGSIFHEFDDRHPNGEALVVKGRRVKVYPTQKVRRAMGDDILRESRKPPTPDPVQVADVLDQTRAAQAALEAAQAAQDAATVAQQAAEGIEAKQRAAQAAAAQAAGKQQAQQQHTPAAKQ